MPTSTVRPGSTSSSAATTEAVTRPTARLLRRHAGAATVPGYFAGTSTSKGRAAPPIHTHRCAARWSCRRPNSAAGRRRRRPARRNSTPSCRLRRPGWPSRRSRKSGTGGLFSRPGGPARPTSTPNTRHDREDRHPQLRLRARPPLQLHLQPTSQLQNHRPAKALRRHRDPASCVGRQALLDRRARR